MRLLIHLNYLWQDFSCLYIKILDLFVARLLTHLQMIRWSINRWFFFCKFGSGKSDILDGSPMMSHNVYIVLISPDWQLIFIPALIGKTQENTKKWQKSGRKFMLTSANFRSISALHFLQFNGKLGRLDVSEIWCRSECWVIRYQPLNFVQKCQKSRKMN